MAVSLDPVPFPDWLKHYFALIDLAEEGERIANEMHQAIQPRPYGYPPAGRFETAPVLAWSARVRSMLPSTDETKELDRVLAMIDAAEKKLSDPQTERDGAGEMLYGVRGAVHEVAMAAGSSIRPRGAQAVGQAIVATLYRQPHSTIWHYNNSSIFGIDDGTLAQFLEELIDGGIFDPTRSRDIVRLTSPGRNWLEKQLSGAAANSDSAEDAAAWSDARRDVEDIGAHLSFMTSDKLRDIAESLQKEILETIMVGASVATMILCGSLVETMLLDVAEQIPHKLTFKKPLDKLSLGDILKGLNEKEIGLVSDTAVGLAIADHRDLVHPNRRRNSTIRIDPKAARAMALLAAIVAHDLADNQARLEALREE